MTTEQLLQNLIDAVEQTHVQMETLPSDVEDEALTKAKEHLWEINQLKDPDIEIFSR